MENTEALMDIRSVFAVRGLRCTKQRLVIYEALVGTKSHPTAEHVFDLVKEKCPGISLATVYNTLDVLCRARLCRRLPVTKGSTRYDADTRAHLHAVDAETGVVLDVPEPLSDQALNAVPTSLIHRIEDELNMTIERVSIQFIGRSNEPLEVPMNKPD